MIAPRTAVIAGICIGLPAALGQVWLLRVNSPGTLPLRGLISLTVAVVVGVLAGLRYKEGAVKVAALVGFVSGVFLSMVGLYAVATSPAFLGQSPFATAESALALIASLMAGTVVSSWIIAGGAALIAYPISISYERRDKE